MSRARVRRLYEELLGRHGRQGWWPIPGKAGRAGFDERGYHTGNYDEPRGARDRFEVIMGAVLTQNTAWTNVEAALANLRESGIRLPRHVEDADAAKLGLLIRPSGYYNQKAKKLRIVAGVFAARGALGDAHAPARGSLLGLWGIGPETADAILLYAFQEPFFVVDAYTRRLLGRIGLTARDPGYDALQDLFHAALPRDAVLFNEYHALIVEHAKVHCRVRPLCARCPVSGCRARGRAT